MINDISDDLVERLRGNYINSLDGSVRSFAAWIPPISLEDIEVIGNTHTGS